jgi:nucleoside-diphosphate-sugar epimerase
MEFINLITNPFGLGEKLILELLKCGESVFAVFPAPKDVPMAFLGKKNIKYGFLKFDQDPVLEKVLPRRVKNVFHIFDMYSGRLTRLFKSNTLATLLLLDWAKHAGVEKFIYLSSGEVYGRGTNLDEKSPCNPHGFYATTKYQAEMLLKFYERAFLINIVRLFFPFGEGVEQGFIFDVAHAIKSSQDINLEYNVIAPTFTDDVVDPIIKIRGQKDAQIHNICGSAVPIDALIADMNSIIQRSPGKVQTRPIQISGNNAKARELLGYKETPLHEALKSCFGSK